MSALIIALALTLGSSFVCSLMEACVLSTTVAEIEALKKRLPRCGALWEMHKRDLDISISTILTLNTVASVVGSSIIGGLAIHLWGTSSLGEQTVLGLVSGGLTLTILVFSEVVPKSVGVVYRVGLQPYVADPLLWMRRVLAPVTFICGAVVRFLVPKPTTADTSDEEIILLAEKGAKEGTLSHSESNIIANALSLDDVRVSQVMTPRTVVAALNKAMTVGEVFKQHLNLPFGRMPVYEKRLDNVVGLVRRRDLFKAKTAGQDAELVANLMKEVQFIPETVTLGHALQLFLKTHQKLAVVVDEYGSVAGVVTMEDIFEHLLGREIFEKDDVAVDMRELARIKTQKPARSGPGRKSAGPESKPQGGGETKAPGAAI
jgi:CBS domain containing-hemolysin-like protein